MENWDNLILGGNSTVEEWYNFVLAHVQVPEEEEDLIDIQKLSFDLERIEKQVIEQCNSKVNTDPKN